MDSERCPCRSEPPQHKGRIKGRDEMTETLTLVRTTTPGGHLATFATRNTTNDAALVFGICAEDEYRFGPGERLTGWGLDIGAHIGIVTVMLALDNPGLRVIAVEGLPDNVAILRENVRLNRLEEKVEVVDAAATDDTTTSVPMTYGYEWVGVSGEDAPVVDTAYVTDSRYIGNIFDYPEGQQAATVITRPGIGLAALLDERDIEEVALAKIDCEGCEWAVLRSPAVKRVRKWIGEYHGAPGFAGVVKALGKTHKVTAVEGAHEGLFVAERKQ